MKFADKLINLRNLISNTLNPIIGEKFYLVDCPFHSNIGDQLIWEGELSLLKISGKECVGYSSKDLFSFPVIDREVTILFHGGGNIGGLYREHTEHLIKIVEHYPDNRIVVFPQTIYYSDLELLQKDAHILGRHKDFHFCVRDKKGYKQLIASGLNNVYLLPDMAFCIPLVRFETSKELRCKGALYLKRVDGELAGNSNDIEADFVKDWPTFEKKIFDGVFLAKVISTLSKHNVPLTSKIWNWYADKYYRRDLINIGINFIKSYDPIISTRLHAIILALLCGQKVKAVDNSYGKISEFVNTWLSDVDEVELLN